MLNFSLKFYAEDFKANEPEYMCRPYDKLIHNGQHPFEIDDLVNRLNIPYQSGQALQGDFSKTFFNSQGVFLMLQLRIDTN